MKFLSMCLFQATFMLREVFEAGAAHEDTGVSVMANLEIYSNTHYLVIYCDKHTNELEEISRLLQYVTNELRLAAHTLVVDISDLLF